MNADLPGPDDVRASVAAVATLLDAATDLDDADARWDSPAGGLTWTCRRTAAHVLDCLDWYAALLARRATGDVEVAGMPETAAIPVLVDSLRSAGAVLAAVVAAAGPADRAWHAFGIADRSGFAAMGCDELIVHGADLASGLGLPFEPPAGVSRRVLRRLFPWAPVEEDPWAALLWANGRAALAGRPPERHWLWHCAPLDQWDGQIRRRAPSTA